MKRGPGQPRVVHDYRELNLELPATDNSHRGSMLAYSLRVTQMRRFLRGVYVACLMVAGICFVLSDTGSWLEMAAGIFLCGVALRTLAVYQHDGQLRAVPRLSLAGGFRIAYELYLGAGALALLAAFTLLELPSALIFGYFIVVWMWMSGWVLWQLRRRPELPRRR